ncbi:membrane protein [Comamonas testosteroni]|uniref:Membrane protein n=1 Tax=Comamonas testosteroni TaxID=285 RepID=A0A0L7N2J1_COMTE|nr:OmpA family protein [Comamonas testosteroni]KOC28397.1 membrane protein [Comamonas testosteroni]KWT68741.1 Cytochrome c oxidase polypeptide II [Comamonas testosteroni]
MSFNSSDDDSQQRFALGFLFALIALVVSTVVGTVVYKRGISHAPKTEAAVSAPSATNVPVVVVEEAARVIVENGVVKFYFVSGKAEVAAGANEALSNVVKGVAEGKRAVISGFHDATGSAEINAELAKQRAQAVQAALVALGVAEDKIELKKPEQSQADGSNAEARRVEVILAD